jgi:monoamine oxidase
LVASSITFFPKLMPEQTQVMHDIPTWMAGQSKVTAVYQRPFWRDQGLSGDGVSRIGPLSEIHDASPEDGSQGALFGFVGWSAQQRQTVGEDLIPQAISQLQQMFGVEAAQPLQVSLQDWAIDPFTATADDGHQHGHPQFGLPPELEGVWHGRIMFSSAEMAEVFGGLVEGALEAAEAAFNGLIEYDLDQ